MSSGNTRIATNSSRHTMPYTSKSIICLLVTKIHHSLQNHTNPQGKARQCKARHDKAKQGKARNGKAREGKARQGTARQGIAIFINIPQLQQHDLIVEFIAIIQPQQHDRWLVHLGVWCIWVVGLAFGAGK